MDYKRGGKYVGAVIGGLVVLFALAFLLGFIGVPQVETIDNRFGDVNESTTEIRTNITVNNPNPIGISLGDTTIDYTVDMNDVRMATGQKEGVSIGTGNSSIELVTYLNNSKIPEWWYTHIRNGERSELLVDADIESGTFGSHNFQTNESIRTDILSAFNSTETRPINASSAAVSDPVLYLNRTSASYGDNLTRQRTPLDMAFTVYNPKPHPYVVTKVGYTIYMNNVTVGEGESDRNTVIPPRPATETIRANTAIRNRNLDEWWVTHIENNQETDLYVDFEIVVEADVPGSPKIPLDSDALDYRTTIETDIFGNKDNTTGSENTSTPDGDSSETDDGSESTPSDGTTETPGSDDGTALPISDDETATPAPDDGTATPVPDDETATPTPDDGGLLAT